MSKRPHKLLDKLIVSSTARAKKDIDQWRVALQQAENAENPKRTLLYNLYDELVLDAHWTSEYEKRTDAIKASKFSLFSSDKKPDQDKTELLVKPWFYEFLEQSSESKSHGHSLLQIGDLVDNEINLLTLIKRKHVIPEKGIFTFRQGDEKGIKYREDDKYYDWLIEIGDDKKLGLLSKAAPYILYKRFALAAWSEYCEVFGMPLRIGKTNVKDTESLNRMENMLMSMATAAYGVIDDNESIEFVETAKSNGDLYDRIIDRCNSEISKLINRAVIGEASQGGSRSKEEVGERTTSTVTQADKQWLQGYINFTLFPKLIKLGYPLTGYTFRWETSKNIKDLWTVTEGLLPYYDVDEQYITDTFGVPVKKKIQAPVPSKNSLDPFV